jgi:hypothetical protein
VREDDDVLTPVVVAEWGGRPAGVDRVAEAVRATLAAVPMPASATADEGWFEVHTSDRVPDDRDALADLVEQHRSRDSQGAIEPLAGVSVAFARGPGAHSADESLPFVSVRVTAGVVIGSGRLAANSVSVSGSSGWLEGVTETERVDLLLALVRAWQPSRAVVVDEPLMLGKPRTPPRTPWPGYASYFAGSLVPEPVLPEAFAVSPFADGRLAVLDRPWDASRVIDGIGRFLEESTYERIPDREPAAVE